MMRSAVLALCALCALTGASALAVSGQLHRLPSLHSGSSGFVRGTATAVLRPAFARQDAPRRATQRLRGGAPAMNADFVLKTVAPLMGNVIGTMMFLSSMPAVLKAKKDGALGNLNPLPYPAIVGNCAAWLFYGAAVSNLWIIAPNVSGLLIGLFYTYAVYPLAKGAEKKRILNTLAAYVALFTAVVAGLKLGLIKASEQTAYGLMSNFCLLFFYAAPLTTLKEVISTKNASSIDPLLSVCGQLNGFFWGVYGFALKDWYVCLPNATGALLNTLTTAARLMYGAK